MDEESPDVVTVTTQLQRRLRNDSIVVVGVMTLLGAIIGTCIVEGLYVNYLDGQMQAKGAYHGQGQKGN